jgi:hypothetical protein
MDATRQQLCPACGGPYFGRGDGEPVRGGGWQGDVRYEWGTYGGVRMARVVERRCPDCGHTEEIDPEWDDEPNPFE